MKCYWLHVDNDGEWRQGEIVNEGSFLHIRTLYGRKMQDDFVLQSHSTDYHKKHICIDGYERIDGRSFKQHVILVSPGWRHPDGSKQPES
jgi:hypothetical protein